MHRRRDRSTSDSGPGQKFMKWRLLRDGEADGAWNMALDEALLLTAGETPILRFYNWQPACLSLGRFQNADELQNGSAVMQERVPGIDWVRRPTGGRAVWHDREITYCFVVRSSSLPHDARSVAGAYRYFSEAFIRGLATLGVSAQIAAGEREAGGARAANCFASATRADFVVDGRKLIGAAQCRKNGAVLQHGSLLIETCESEWRRALGAAGDGKDATEGTVTLRSLGVQHSESEIIEALCEGARAAFGAQLAVERPSRAELALAKGLQVRYRSPEWNYQGLDRALLAEPARS